MSVILVRGPETPTPPNAGRAKKKPKKIVANRNTSRSAVTLMVARVVPLALVAADVDTSKLAEIDTAVEAALKRGDCPGAVVVIVHDDKIVYRKAFGKRAVKPEDVAMTLDTVFDMASLTKPVATGTSVMLLLQQGKLKPDDLVSKHWPEFAASGKEKVTVEHLLLHTSGLTADNAATDFADGRAKAFDRIAALKLEAPLGTRFKYSDVGFIVLGELVDRISGMPVDKFASKHVFAPLKTLDTTFTPARKRLEKANCAHRAARQQNHPGRSSRPASVQVRRSCRARRIVFHRGRPRTLLPDAPP